MFSSTRYKLYVIPRYLQVGLHAIRDSASPRHLELFSNKVKTEKHNVTKLR